MSKILKKYMAQELTKELENVDSFVAFKYEGINSLSTYELRKACFEQNITMKVVKNTMAKIALSEGYPKELAFLFKGPTAMLYGGESIVSVAKLIIEWKKKNKAIEIKGGYIPGSVLKPQEVEALSDIPPKEVLLSILAGAFQAPLQQIASVMAAPLQNISYAVDNVASKMEESNLEKAADCK